MLRMTPPMHARGTFTCTAPWDALVISDTIYEVVGLRTFADMESRTISVKLEVYEANNVSEEIYLRDLDLNCLIVSLQDDKGQMVYIPDSHIISFPDMGSRNYHHVVLSVSLGPLPEVVVLDSLLERMAEVVVGSIGSTADINVNVVPYTKAVSSADHEALEIARNNAIVNRETDYALLLRKTEEYDDMHARYLVLEQLVLDNNLL